MNIQTAKIERLRLTASNSNSSVPPLEELPEPNQVEEPLPVQQPPKRNKKSAAKPIGNKNRRQASSIPQLEEINNAQDQLEEEPLAIQGPQKQKRRKTASKPTGSKNGGEQGRHQLENEPTTSGLNSSNQVENEPAASGLNSSNQVGQSSGGRKKPRKSMQRKAAEHLARNFAARKFASVGARGRGLTQEDLVGDLPSEDEE